MKHVSAAVVLWLAAGLCAAQTPPEWAYPVNPPGFKPRPDDGTPRHVPDSSASYSLTQLRDRFISPVWHPAEHPPQPEVVAHGRKPDVFAQLVLEHFKPDRAHESHGSLLVATFVNQTRQRLG